MQAHMTPREIADETWYWYLNGTNKVGLPQQFVRKMDGMQRVFDLLPAGKRCSLCHMPLSGPTSIALRTFGWHASVLTPRLCNQCENMILATEGGAEVELSLLFADIRGSTAMAEQRGSREYIEFIQRFYKTSAQVLIEHNAFVNRLVGDQVIGLFVTRFAGVDHTKVAIESALEILRATGHTDPDGPWAPVGVGLHTGKAYVGAVGSRDGVKEIAVLGNSANLTARLSSQAAEGELLVSENAAKAAGLNDPKLEKRKLTLKGISQPVEVRVMTVDSEQGIGHRK